MVGFIMIYIGFILWSVLCGILMFIVLLFIYGLFYFFLKFEDYVLLVGLVVVFVVLVIMMFVILWIDWGLGMFEKC